MTKSIHLFDGDDCYEIVLRDGYILVRIALYIGGTNHTQPKTFHDLPPKLQEQLLKIVEETLKDR